MKKYLNVKTLLLTLLAFCGVGAICGLTIYLFPNFWGLISIMLFIFMIGLVGAIMALAGSVVMFQQEKDSPRYLQCQKTVLTGLWLFLIGTGSCGLYYGAAAINF